MTTIKRAKKVQPFIITEVYFKLLVGIARYHLVTAAQLCRLYYSRGTITTVKTRLKRLVDEGYILALNMPTSRGNAAHVYMLARRGIYALIDMGYDNASFRPSTEREKEKNYLYLYHCLETNDFLIAAAKLGETPPLCSLIEMRHDRELKRTPFVVSVDAQGKDEKITIIPDGFLVFGSPNGDLHVWLELDRGTVEAKNFRKKVRAIVTFVHGGEYEKAFGTNDLTIAIATTAGEIRAGHLLKWIELELTSLGKAGYAGIFFVACVPSHTEEPVEPSKLFLERFWSCPFASGRFPLLG